MLPFGRVGVLACAVGLLTTTAGPVAPAPAPVPLPAALPGLPAPATPVYSAPLTAPLRVERAFDPPHTVYGAGHLGVDLAAAAGGVVRAAGAGTVRFAGSVAGRGVIVIGHSDGLSTEYEPVRPLVAAGGAVRRGQPIAVLRGAHRGCTSPCLHWGARRGTRYLDPLSLLTPLPPVRLLPWPAPG
jgi:murein DD-endopeptidase MepM/ murein hydrolase activator NlpD